jgi:hypothetical protein
LEQEGGAILKMKFWTGLTGCTGLGLPEFYPEKSIISKLLLKTAIKSHFFLFLNKFSFFTIWLILFILFKFRFPER